MCKLEWGRGTYVSVLKLDELTFKFKIVEEYATEDYTFETLNYFLDSYDLLDNDSAADIDNYLLVGE